MAFFRRKRRNEAPKQNSGQPPEQPPGQAPGQAPKQPHTPDIAELKRLRDTAFEAAKEGTVSASDALPTSSEYVAALRRAVSTDPASRMVYAFALKEHANLLANSGARTDAVTALQVALEVTRGAAEQVSGAGAEHGEDQVLTLRGELLEQRARLLVLLGREREGFESFRDALATLARLVEIDRARYEEAFLEFSQEVFEAGTEFMQLEAADAAKRGRLAYIAAWDPRPAHIWDLLVSEHLELANMWLAVAGERVRGGLGDAATDATIAGEIARGRGVLDEMEALVHQRALDDPEQGAAGMVDVFRFRAKAAAVEGDTEAMLRHLGEAIDVGRPFAGREGSPVLLPLSVAYAERTSLRQFSEEPESVLSDSAESLAIARLIAAPLIAAYEAGRTSFVDGAAQRFGLASAVSRHAGILAWFGREAEAQPLAAESVGLWQDLTREAAEQGIPVDERGLLWENLQRATALLDRLQPAPPSGDA